jgi:tetratricopeptide (TPR) repeat protein
MSTQTITHPRTRRRWPRIALVIVLLAGVAAAGYWWQQSRQVSIPVYSAEGLDPAIAAAINEARAAVERSPRSSEAWAHYALVLFAHDKYVECRVPFEQAEKLDPQDPRWPYYRGLALLYENPTECAAALRKALALNPQYGPFKLRLAEQLLQLDQPDEAEVLFREILKAAKNARRMSPNDEIDFPGEPRAWLGVGKIQMRRQHWNDAIEPLRSAANHPGSRKAAHSALAEVYFVLGKEQEVQAERTKADALPADVPWADPLIQEADKLRTGLVARIDRAKALESAGAAPEAIAAIRQIASDYPNSDEAQFTLGRILLEVGEVEKAEIAFRETLTINPKHADALYLLAVVLFSRKDYVGAEDCLQRAVAEWSTFYKAYFDLGQCRLKLGNKAGAEQAFRSALRARPDLARAHLALGELLLETGKRGEAISYLENALKYPQTNAKAQELLDQAKRK